MHDLFATGCEETMFNIVLNMHELFNAGGDEKCSRLSLTYMNYLALDAKIFLEIVLNPLTATFRV